MRTKIITKKWLSAALLIFVLLPAFSASATDGSAGFFHWVGGLFSSKKPSAALIKPSGFNGGSAAIGQKNTTDVIKRGVIPSGIAGNLPQTNPQVLAVSPPNGITAVVTDPITVMFDRKMDANSVTNSISLIGWFILPKELKEGEDFIVIPSLAPEDVAMKKFTIYPKEPLVPNIAYVVKIAKGGPKDEGGAAMGDCKNLADSGSTCDWSFTTSEHPCLDPELDFEFTKRDCTLHTDTHFLGSTEQWLTSDYVVNWTSKNVTYVEEDCHGYTKQTNFDGDAGTIEFQWDGPPVDQPNPPDFTSAALGHLFREVFDPLPAAYASYPAPTVMQKYGTYNCNVTAHGACNKFVTVPYWYSCKF